MGIFKLSRYDSRAENECHTNISFDTYYSNEEFLRRWESQKKYYDIIIFSDTIYNLIKNDLANFPNNKLFNQALAYHPVIKKHYQSRHYPHNVVYFFQGLTGFLWNPNNININPTDSIISIFKKAANKYAVIIDDPVEAWKLTEAALHQSGRHLSFNDFTFANFNQLIQQSNVYIATNNYSEIYKKPDFAFSYSWSGEAIAAISKTYKNYRFLIHPQLSHVSSDLLAQTTNDKASYCVAKFLSSKKTLSYLQKNNFYFSPYPETLISNALYQKIYKNYESHLSSLTWIDSMNEEDLDKLNMSLQLIKIALNESNNHE